MKCCSVKVLSAFLVASIIVLIVSLVLIFKVFPDVIYDQVNKQVRLENGSEAFDRFMQLPFALEFKIYIFNVSNPYEILQGGKAKVKQVGPYVWRENRTRTILANSSSEDTLDYIQTLKFDFDKEVSNGLDTDIVTVLNNPLLVMFSTGELIPLIDTGCFIQTFEEAQQSVFINITVREYIFDGFQFCKTLGSGIMCQIVNSAACLEAEKIKFIDKLEDNSLKFSLFNYKRREPDGNYTVKRGIDDPSTLGSIIKWNNDSYTDFWGHNKTTCEKVSGGDSTLYPPRISKDDTLTIFSTDICRTIDLTYSRTGTYKDIDGYYFQTNNKTFQSSMQDKSKDCFCTGQTRGLDGQKSCFLDGVVDVQSCTGVPTVLSFPHFLEAEHYLEYVDGLKPNASIHQTFVLLEPNTGIPLQGYKRVQINTVLRPFNRIEATKSVTPALMPMFWLEEGVSLSDEFIDQLNDDYFSQISLLDWIQYGLLAIAAALVVFFGVLTVTAAVRLRKKGKQVA